MYRKEWGYTNASKNKWTQSTNLGKIDKKQFWAWGIWPRGLLTTYGISPGGRLTGVTKTRGASDRGAIDRRAIGLSPTEAPGRLTHRRVKASGTCSGQRVNVLIVGTLRSAWRRQALRRSLREERGTGILCRHVHSLLKARSEAK